MEQYCYIFAFIIVLLIGRIVWKGKFKQNHITRNTLIITAHPDDECMFFAPTILSISKSQPQSIFVVCLSNGNFYGSGVQRESELSASLDIFGVSKENRVLINEPSLQDGPNNFWDYNVITEIVLKLVETKRIRNILTFDDYGVSGHRNHCDIAKALYSSRSKFSHVNILFLESISIFRKYLGIFDLLYVLFTNKNFTFTNTPRGLLKTNYAMFSHQSQYTWYRILYILYSRYVYINQFIPMSQIRC